MGCGLETTTKDRQFGQCKRDFSKPRGHPAINSCRAAGFWKEIFSTICRLFFLYFASALKNLLLVCDHASNNVPVQLDFLGLTSQQLASHIGWDSGAAAVSRKLSHKLDAPLILSNYSRLVIDCNRWPAAEDSIPLASGGIVIPGNASLTEDDKLNRRLTLFEPYQGEISALLSNAEPQCALLSIHSFTPCLFGTNRPWSIGVCYRNDVPLAQRWRTSLRACIDKLHAGSPNELVGCNEPYAIEPGCDYTIPVQGESRGNPSIMLEIRQDKIADPAGVDLWSDIIAEAWFSMQTQ